jgi:hypothetical protein
MFTEASGRLNIDGSQSMLPVVANTLIGIAFGSQATKAIDNAPSMVDVVAHTKAENNLALFAVLQFKRYLNGGTRV